MVGIEYTYHPIFIFCNIFVILLLLVNREMSRRHVTSIGVSLCIPTADYDTISDMVEFWTLPVCVRAVS